MILQNDDYVASLKSSVTSFPFCLCGGNSFMDLSTIYYLSDTLYSPRGTLSTSRVEKKKQMEVDDESGVNRE